MDEADTANRDMAGFSARKAREERNVFSRLPAICAASRSQGQKILQHGGGLSIVEWRTLWDLHEAGPMTIRALSDLQRADHSLLSRALPNMRDKGYVTMQRGKRDARQTLVALAPAGEAAYLLAAPIMAKRRQALRNAFSDSDFDTLLCLLDKLDDFLHQPVDELIGKTDKS